MAAEHDRVAARNITAYRGTATRIAGVGRALREAREARELTYEDVERETRIGRRYVEAIEAEDHDALPAPVYARGFVRSYARFLGLDGEALSALFFPPPADPVVAEAPASAIYAEPQRVRRPFRQTARGWAVGAGLACLFGLAIALGVPALTGSDDEGTPAEANIGGAGPDTAGRALPLATPDTGDRPRTLDAPTVVPLVSGGMPDLRGRAMSDALGELRDLGVPFIVIETPSERVDPGRVLQQVPNPGARVGRNTSVTLVVSSGPVAPEDQPATQ
jgi:transcriptional regulator with XRE-family HTH domain